MNLEDNIIAAMEDRHFNFSVKIGSDLYFWRTAERDEIEDCSAALFEVLQLFSDLVEVSRYDYTDGVYDAVLQVEALA